MQNERITEGLVVGGAFGPATAAGTGAAAATTNYFDLRGCRRAVGILALGDMAAETVDFELTQSTSSTGAGEKTLKAATQRAADAAGNDERQIVVEVGADEPDTGFRYLRGKATTGGAGGGIMSILLLGARPGVAPGSHATTVAEVKV